MNKFLCIGFGQTDYSVVWLDIEYFLLPLFFFFQNLNLKNVWNVYFAHICIFLCVWFSCFDLFLNWSQWSPPADMYVHAWECIYNKHVYIGMNVYIYCWILTILKLLLFIMCLLLLVFSFSFTPTILSKINYYLFRSISTKLTSCINLLQSMILYRMI